MAARCVGIFLGLSAAAWAATLPEIYRSGELKDEARAAAYWDEADATGIRILNDLVEARWNYYTNLTEHNKKVSLEKQELHAAFSKEVWKNATQFAWKEFKNETLKRAFKMMALLGDSILPEDKLQELLNVEAEMTQNHASAKVCPHIRKTNRSDECNIPLEPNLKRLFDKSRNYDELLHAWTDFRRVAGKPVRKKYLRYVELLNESARLNGFKDAGAYRREEYETEDFEEQLDNLWEQLKPLYEQLHAYVRRKLMKVYGNEKIQPDGPIPAHLLTHIHAQRWSGISSITQPYPGKPSVDVTSKMIEKNMTALEMFKLSEEFFTSLGLLPMPEVFWKKSVITRPKDREIVCHASAWDFYSNDVRIKQCTSVTMSDLLVVHHEMGHVEYFLQYAGQPSVFRNGANPGFHEAIGDVLALSVSSPKHLKAIGLLDEVAEDPEGDINYLYSLALQKVAVLPSTYLYDLWRWRVYSGEYSKDELNTKWWELLLKYQGICPGVKRTEEDFDPAAKYHISSGASYIQYFVSKIHEFQFHKALCEAAGHQGPLYTCDIYNSKEAGQLLSKVLQLGSSKPWTEALKLLTNGRTDKLDAEPLLEFFAPLMKWLQEQNEGSEVGWKSEDPTICPNVKKGC